MAHRRGRKLLWVAVGAVGAAGLGLLVRTMRRQAHSGSTTAPRPEVHDHAPPGGEPPEAEELAEEVGHPVEDPAHAPGHRRLPPPPKDPLPSGGGKAGTGHMPGHRGR